MARIALIDYESGNLRSVSRALESVGAGVHLAATPNELAGADAVVLPGVGAFGDATLSLRKRGLWEPVKEWVLADKPFLGICLGYQILFAGSEESPDQPGFGVFPGKVVRFTDPALKIPHMGWNTIEPTVPGEDLWAGLPPAPHVFFVHSFYPEPADPALVSSRCTYGIPFAASVRRGRVRATQFHPEKSQDIGLRMLRNFIDSL